MNFEEIEKELNELMKHGQELIEKLKRDKKTESDFDVYEINFNAKAERFYCSKEDVNYDKAQQMAQRIGKKTLTVSELWKEDNSGIPRWQLLKDAGCKKWVWCQEYSDSAAYYVGLTNGNVDTDTRVATNLAALCL